jgi:hypothetical protein
VVDGSPRDGRLRQIPIAVPDGRQAVGLVHGELQGGDVRGGGRLLWQADG